MAIEPFAELPLALFSTLIPLSVGIYLALAIESFCPGRQSPSPKGALKSAVVPLVIAALAFVAAFFHLTSPLNAVYVLSGVGRSPLSTEIVAVGLYFVAGVVYFVLAASGKLGLCGRRIALSAVSVLGLLAAVMVGLAYHVDTIIGWASPWPAVEQVGYSLFAVLAGALVSRCSFGDSDACFVPTAVTAFVGFAVSVFANGAHLFQVSNSSGVVFEGSGFAAAALPYAVAALVAGAVAMALFLRWTSVSSKEESARLPLLAASTVLLVVAIFLARISFYCLQLGIGLA